MCPLTPRERSLAYIYLLGTVFSVEFSSAAHFTKQLSPGADSTNWSTVANYLRRMYYPTIGVNLNLYIKNTKSRFKPLGTDIRKILLQKVDASFRICLNYFGREQEHENLVIILKNLISQGVDYPSLGLSFYGRDRTGAVVSTVCSSSRTFVCFRVFSLSFPRSFKTFPSFGLTSFKTKLYFSYFGCLSPHGKICYRPLFHVSYPRHHPPTVVFPENRTMHFSIDTRPDPAT